MSLILRKAWRDLALNKGRTILTVVSIAVGVFALGLIFGAYDLISTSLAQVNRLASPTHIYLWGDFDHEATRSLSGQPGVARVEAGVDVWLVWQRAGDDNWRDAALLAHPDYADQCCWRVTLLQGDWPGGHSLAVERQTAQYFGLSIGDAILLRAGKQETRLTISGVVHDYDRQPPHSGGPAAFYLAPETLEWLAATGYNRLEVILQTYPGREEAVKIAQALKKHLQRAGYAVWGEWAADPTQHWFQEGTDTMLVILTILGALSLGMSAFLVVNTINAMIAGQTWQIGVLKTLGATSWRVTCLYLTTAALLGLLAFLLAAPLSAAAAYQLAAWILDRNANIILQSFHPSLRALAIQLAVSLLVPPLAALLPTLNGARISPHQAISSYGLGGRFGRGWLDHLLTHLDFLPRPLALSLRNTFRRKGRVVLTLLMLALGGVMFIMVMGVMSSFLTTVDVLLDVYGDDLRLGFDKPYPVQVLANAAQDLPGVERVEVWGYRGADLKLADGSERYLGLRSVPSDSQIFHPRVVAGRSLLPGDGHAILLNHKIATDEGYNVGDVIEFEINGRRTAWTVVGLILFPEQYDSFVPFAALAEDTGMVNRGQRVHVITTKHDLAFQQGIVQALWARYAAQGIEPAWAWSTGEMRANQWEQYSIIHYLLLTMALLAALVGGVGLMGIMSINVVERRREIGVLRAGGATSFALSGIFVVEGVLLGALSWLLALPFSFPAASLASRMIGQELLHSSLIFNYSIPGLLLWLLIVVTLSILACLWPALQACRLSVHEALAYE